MESDELKDVLQMNFPNYKIDKDKIISLCKNQEMIYNTSFFKKTLYFTIVMVITIVITATAIPFAYNYVTGINNRSKTIPGDTKTNLAACGNSVATDFFIIDGTSNGKPEDPIRIGYKSEYSIFNNSESLEIEVLIGYFGNLYATGLFSDDSALPKIVLRTSDEPIVEYDLIEINQFLEKYKLKYLVSENDNIICGCKYVFPDEAQGIKLSIDSDYFSGIFGEIRIGLYVGYMYKAETIYYCKNEENGTICISSTGLEEAMKKANYEYINDRLVE